MKYDDIKGTGAVTNEYWNSQFVIFLILDRAGVLDDYTLQQTCPVVFNGSPVDPVVFLLIR